MKHTVSIWEWYQLQIDVHDIAIQLMKENNSPLSEFIKRFEKKCEEYEPK